MSSTPVELGKKQRTLFGHPLGLYVLFFTEMWERFSYYGMRALLLLYMINYFKWPSKDASSIYKIYTSLVFVTPILGGFLADRLLGNRLAVIIGAVLMAIGHFMMASEHTPIFIGALVFLILGNGFFKPNMSTQVGRLYPPNDGRLDGAYTIFYMGINLGAFLSPLVCGMLAENTLGGYHTGFTVAGIGMVIGLATYLLGQPLIREIPPVVAAPAEPKTDAIATAPSNVAADERPLTEAEADRVPSVMGSFAKIAPFVLYALGVAMLLASPALIYLGLAEFMNGVILGIGGFCLVLFGFVTTQVNGGLRDRVLAILVLGVFVMFFWAAFEQAGSVFAVWADKHTNRYITDPLPEASVIPEVIEDEAPATNDKGVADAPVQKGVVERFFGMFKFKPAPADAPNLTYWQSFLKGFNPVPTASYQSINALAIFLFAPLFAILWTWLDRRKLQPSIPLKMFIGLVMMTASTGIMIAAAKEEHRFSESRLDAPGLPTALELTSGNELGRKNSATGAIEPFNAGRLTYDSTTKTFSLWGVLPDLERDLIIEKTAPKEYAKLIEELKKDSEKIDGDKVKSASVKIDTLPPGFDMKYAGLKKSVVRFDPKEKTLTALKPMADKEVKGLLLAAGDPNLRSTIHSLYVKSNTFRVASMWLVWSFILATFGELCLSPVGLSMVSKLAPARYATMLMGVWFLTSAFGNYAAGAFGEIWGTIAPIPFFIFSTAVVGGSAVVLLVLVRLVVGMMHKVK